MNLLPSIVNFLRSENSKSPIAISGISTAMQKTDYEKVSFGRVPFVWKKKISNLAKEDPEQAIKVFFSNFQMNNEPKQMIYGFEQTLPQSMVYILNHLEELNSERFEYLISMFNDSNFLDSLLSVGKTEQTKFLDRMVQNWDIVDKSIIQRILSQLNPELSEKSYKDLVTAENNSLIELLSFWVKCDVRVLYLVLTNYIIQPTDLILPLLRKTPKESLITACNAQNLPGKLSPKKIEPFLKMFDETQEEINYLFPKFSSSSSKAQQSFLDWLIAKKIPVRKLLGTIPPSDQVKTKALFISYFSLISKDEKAEELNILTKIVDFSLYQTASFVLEFLDKKKDTVALDYLDSLLMIFQKDLEKHLEFFASAFQKYSINEKQRLITTYFKTEEEIIGKILLPSINTLKTSQWKKLIEQIIQQRYYIDKNRVFLLLNSFNAKIINAMSKYIIKTQYLPQLSFLYSNYEFFRPLLTTSEPIDTTVYSHLAESMKTHFTTHFDEIIVYGSKITFPKSIIASGFTEKEVSKLVSGVGFEKTLIIAWEEVFLLRPDESLPLFLKQFASKTKKSKDPIVSITKKLIDIESGTFWKYISSLSNRSLSKYRDLLIHALDKSIPLLSEILISLPRTHTTYLGKSIIPEFEAKSQEMLYAILSVNESSFLNHKSVDGFILSILKQNPRNLIFPALMRLSALESDSSLLEFVKKLFSSIISKYPRVTIEIIDDHALSSFSPSVAVYFDSLTEKKLRILLKYIILQLKTKCLKPTLIDQCLSQFRHSNNNYRLLQEITTADPSKEFSTEGRSLLSSVTKQIVGTSIENDVKILALVKNSHTSIREELLGAYFEKIPQNTLDYVLSDQTIDISDELTVRALTIRFAKRPPQAPEEFYLSLYQQSTRNEIKRAVLPLVGEYCSWTNLPFLMELPERNEFKQEYSAAIKKFIQRFEIESEDTLFRIWSSGLKDIYDKRGQASQVSTSPSKQRSSYQSNCPKCNNPILEGQKNCGFCTQRLTCPICLKSVIKASDVDLVECTQCSNIFHRPHLLQSVKMRHECPICHVRLTERMVLTLPSIQFQFY